MCVVGTVGKISDYQTEGSGFFRHTVRGQERQAVCLVSRRSIGGLKRTHKFVENSRLMPVLWTVTSSTTEGARPRRDHVSCYLCSC